MDTQKVINGLDQLYESNQSGQVEEYLSSNLEQALNEKDIGTAVTIINELIGFYRDSSQYDKALVYCEKLLPFMERAGMKDTIHYGTSCLNIANAYRAAGLFEESLQHYNMVFSIYNMVLEPGDYRFAGLHNNLSLLYQEMGEYEKASGSLCRALSIIKEIPEAIVEQAVTYTNLAASYIKAGRLEQAKEAAQSGLSIFQDGLTNDFHYSAVLAVMGDIHFAEKQYETAASYFEQAMIALKQHVGLTHAYFRLVSNLQMCFEAMGRTDALQGMTMAKDYFSQFGKEAFKAWIEESSKGESSKEEYCKKGSNKKGSNKEESNKAGSNKVEYNSHREKICFAKVGEGSECFGLDDIISKDHDFGPGFCIFVSREQYEMYGKELESIYNSLPEHFRGFSKPKVLTGAPRNGIIVLEDFLSRILSLKPDELDYLLRNNTLSEETWLRMEDWRLCTVTNGEVFDGRNSVFYNIYSNLRKGYPESVRKKKIAQKIGEICQEGQYNYPRLMQRQDLYGALMMLHSFEEHTVELLYLLNGVYAPHKKWLMKSAASLSKGHNVLVEIQSLMLQIPDVAIYQEREMVDWIGTTNKNDRIYTEIQQIALDIAELLRQEGLSKSQSLYLEDHIQDMLD